MDNRQKGLVTGSLWLAGRESPVVMELHGNFLRDMAGCEVAFQNPSPQSGNTANMDTIQIGMTGDMTASRKVNSPDAPALKANALYLEWFSETTGRVVIETTDFDVRISTPEWIMSAEEEQNQIAANRQSFRDWLEHLSEMEDVEMDRTQSQRGRPMNEFEWEKVLKDSDKRNERLGEVLEKYHGHPDSERLIAREMGWTWVEEELEAQERGVFAEVEELDQLERSDDSTPPFLGSDDDEDDEDDAFDEEIREPNPLREGIDWVRDADGSIEHPLAAKSLAFSSALWREFEEQGMLGETGDSRIFEWAGLVESAGVRLSTTLGDVAFGAEVEPGYVIAGLKRAVSLVHQSLDMLQKIEPLNLVARDRAKIYQQDLFEIREDILGLMKSYRAL